MHANRPLKDIACVLYAQTKDATVVCVIGCQITRTRIHTLPKRLASARHSRKENCTLTRFTLHASNKSVSEDEKADDVFSRRHLYCGTPVVTSWAVAGQQVVFLHMYLQTRVTLRAFPVATPRGRSSSSHGGEQHSVPFSFINCNTIYSYFIRAFIFSVLVILYTFSFFIYI